MKTTTIIIILFITNNIFCQEKEYLFTKQIDSLMTLKQQRDETSKLLDQYKKEITDRITQSGKEDANNEKKIIIEDDNLLDAAKYTQLIEVYQFAMDNADIIPFESSTVSIYDELLELFNPDNFDCYYDSNFKRKLKDLVRNRDAGDKSVKAGYIPKEITKDITEQLAMKVKNLDCTVLANSFKYEYKENETTVRKSAHPRQLTKISTFNLANEMYAHSNNFVYNIDCTGLISNIASADIGISTNSISSAIKSSASSDKLLLIMQGNFESPLYSAYKGIGDFDSRNFNGDEQKEIDKKRLKILRSITDVIPNYAQRDDTKIFLNADYTVMLTSNSGRGSFSGKVEGSAKGNYNFILGGISGGINGAASISRNNAFNNMNTYVIAVNKFNQPDIITYKDINQKIKELSSKQ